MKAIDISCQVCGGVSPMLGIRHAIRDRQHAIRLPEGWRWMLFDDRSNDVNEWIEVAVCDMCVPLWDDFREG